MENYLKGNRGKDKAESLPCEKLPKLTLEAQKIMKSQREFLRDLLAVYDA